MKAEEFVEKRKKELDNFAKNMNSLETKDQKESVWMEKYLAWAEWTDPIMRDIIWEQNY
jgi:hypothetical protein